MITPFGERQSGDARLKDLQLRRGERAILAVEPEFTGGEDCGFVAPNWSIKAGDVPFRRMCPG